MSEFAETYHLETENQTESIATLQRAGLHGWIFPPGNGWATLIADGGVYGVPNPQLVAAAEVPLLYHVNAEDHGWMFAIFEGGVEVCHYECLWIDIENTDEDTISIRDEGLDMNKVVRVAGRHGASGPETEEALRELLNPPDREWLRRYYLTHAFTSVGAAFGDLLGLPHHRWIAAHYLERDERRGSPRSHAARV